MKIFSSCICLDKTERIWEINLGARVKSAGDSLNTDIEAKNQAKLSHKMNEEKSPSLAAYRQFRMICWFNGSKSPSDRQFACSIEQRARDIHSNFVYPIYLN